MAGECDRRAAARRRNEARELRLMTNVEVKSGTGSRQKKGSHVDEQRADNSRRRPENMRAATSAVESSPWRGGILKTAKRTSATELVWLITKSLREELGPRFATSLAGWRSVIASPSRNRLNRKLLQKLAQVEERLRREYSLANWVNAFLSVGHGESRIRSMRAPLLDGICSSRTLRP